MSMQELGMVIDAVLSLCAPSRSNESFSMVTLRPFNQIPAIAWPD